MSIYVYIKTGYEGNYDQRLPNYDLFVQEIDKQMKLGILLQVDGRTQEGKKKLVDSIMNQAEVSLNQEEKIFLPGASSPVVYKHIHRKLNVNNPLYIVDNDDENTLNALIQLCRDLDYCHIWNDDPIERKVKIELDNNNTLIYLKLEAESG